MAKTRARLGVALTKKSPAKPSAGPGKRNAAASNGGARRKARIGRSAGADAAGKESAKKVKRGKVMRDSFTMPVADYALIGALKKRCIGLGVAIKKSELLRAGLATLERLSDESLAEVVAAVESVKTGRPPSEKKKKKRAKGKKQ